MKAAGSRRAYALLLEVSRYPDTASKFTVSIDSGVVISRRTEVFVVVDL